MSSSVKLNEINLRRRRQKKKKSRSSKVCDCRAVELHGVKVTGRYDTVQRRRSIGNPFA
jgi:hypothetical protein